MQHDWYSVNMYNLLNLLWAISWSVILFLSTNSPTILMLDTQRQAKHLWNFNWSISGQISHLLYSQAGCQMCDQVYFRSLLLIYVNIKCNVSGLNLVSNFWLGSTLFLCHYFNLVAQSFGLPIVLCIAAKAGGSF